MMTSGVPCFFASDWSSFLVMMSKITGVTFGCLRRRHKKKRAEVSSSPRVNFPRTKTLARSLGQFCQLGKPSQTLLPQQRVAGLQGAMFVGEAVKKCFDGPGFVAGQLPVELKVSHLADSFGEGRHLSVVKVRRGQHHVAQRGNFEFETVIGIASNFCAAQVVGVRVWIFQADFLKRIAAK